MSAHDIRVTLPLLAALLVSVPSTASALDVALQAAENSTIREEGETYQKMAELLAAAGHTATVVTADEIDTLPEIWKYDVVVLYGGVSQREAGLEYRKLDSVIEDYVWGGGGVIFSGWTLSFMATPPVRPRHCNPSACDNGNGNEMATCGCANSQYCDEQTSRCMELFDLPGLNAITPQEPGFGFDGDGGAVKMKAHPMTKGLRDFTLGAPPEGTYSQTSGPLKEGADLLTTIDGVPESSAWVIGVGGVAHLGPVYTAESQFFSNEELLDGSIPAARDFFISAVEWVADPPVCGNGVVNQGEECDDENDDNTDTCLDTCQNAFCGDGYLQAGEECDEGYANNDSVPNACRSTCQSAYCGDGVVDSGEGCDSGELNGAPNSVCSSHCTPKLPESCGLDGECEPRNPGTIVDPVDGGGDASPRDNVDPDQPADVVLLDDGTSTAMAGDGCGGCRTGGGSASPTVFLLFGALLFGRLRRRRSDETSPAR